jgi:hypothetical protein
MTGAQAVNRQSADRMILFISYPEKKNIKKLKKNIEKTVDKENIILYIKNMEVADMAKNKKGKVAKPQKKQQENGGRLKTLAEILTALTALITLIVTLIKAIKE